jgi:DNA-binding MarR family transcriptional regulator
VPSGGDSSVQPEESHSSVPHSSVPHSPVPHSPVPHSPVPHSPVPLPDRRPEAVGFLLSQLGFEVSARFGKLMAEVDLEPRQFALMRAIEASEGHSQNAVAEWLRIPASSMVALIDQLEERGLIERRLHPTDRRSRTLHTTRAGRELLESATELAMGLELTICAGIEEAERSRMLDLLARVADNLGLVQGLHPGATAVHGSQDLTNPP